MLVVGVGTVYRFNDRFCISVDDVRGFHHVLDIFKFDCWIGPILTLLREDCMARGSVDTSTVDHDDQLSVRSEEWRSDAAEARSEGFFPWCLVLVVSRVC